MAENTQHRLDRIRPPRVHITYDVETGGAIEMKELPFVMGVLADLSGNPAQPLPRLRVRKFVEIDRDNFNQVMQGMTPRLEFNVENKLSNDSDKQLKVELTFKSMDDFHPEQVANQVGPLKELIRIREQLSSLLAKTAGNDELSDRLQSIIENTELLEQIREEAGSAPSDGEGRQSKRRARDERSE